MLVVLRECYTCVPEVQLPVAAAGAKLAWVMKEAGLAPSTTEAMRLLKQGAVRVGGERISTPETLLFPGETYLLQVGKRGIAKINCIVV